MGTTNRSLPRPPARRSRMLGSLAYFGPSSLIIVALLPRSPFVMRHSMTALTLHLVRLGWTGLLIFLWTIKLDGEQSGHFAQLAGNLGLLLLTGIPWLPGMEHELVLLLALPLGVTWLLAIAGGGAAYTGHTMDIQALLTAHWPDEPPEPVADDKPDPAAERAQARALRERQLARIWNASLLAQTERRRGERIDQVKFEMEAVLGRLDHLNHLLSYGEVSLSRFTAAHSELIAYLDALRRELSDLQSRRGDVVTASIRPTPPLALTELPPVKVATMALLDRGGVPIFTYGHFPLDESLVTGMVSALDSLSEEMFGSRVHKTQLAEGRVVYFARGRWATAFVVFEDEPAPAQIGELRAFLDLFEEENAGRLDTLPIDPATLTEVPVPFEFLRRLGTEAVSDVAAPR